MLNINKVKDGTTLTISIEGRLDTTTAPQLENVVNVEIEVPAVDLDGPAVVIDAASRHGDYKGMRTEPGITRHLDV